MSLYDDQVAAMKRSLNVIGDLVTAKNFRIEEREKEISELREALILKDEEITALQDRIAEMETQYMQLLTSSQLRNPVTGLLSETEYAQPVE